MLTPCIGVCTLHPHSNCCIGCGRTEEEIANWAKYSPTHRAKIMKELGYDGIVARPPTSPHKPMDDA